MKELVDAAEVARMLGVTEHWVRAHARDRRPLMPSYKIGKWVRFDAEKVREWAKENLQRGAR